VPSLALWMATSDSASLPLLGVGSLLAGGKMKFGCLTTGGVLGDDATQLFSGVPESVIVFPLAQVSHEAFKSCASIPLASLSMSSGLDKLAPSTQCGLRCEVS
jgi:hypothetical protein